jgi:TonB family protein
LPAETAQVVGPAQQAAERSANRLIFPVPPQPEVVPPASAAATSHAVPVLPLNGPVVIPPSQSLAARDASRLQLPAQAPDVAAPASAIAQRNAAQALPMARPEVVPPAQTAGARNLAALAVPAPAQNVVPPASSVAQRNLAGMKLSAPSQAVVPPAQPVAAGAQMNQLLALSVQPVAPVGPVSVPEGNRRGEFAVSPEGRPGATAAPETRAANNAQPPGAPAKLFVAPPPNRIVADAVVAAPPSLPKSSNSPERADVPADRIDNQVFAGRRNYAIRLSMPNINSAMGSWIIRFAELNPDNPEQAGLSTPEPIRKVDPAYPAAMMRDRIEGVVVLHAIIRSDGTVADVRVLEGFDPRLDENARSALEQWRFRPGTRNGVPVDVEAVVRVPFRVPKPAF